MFLIVHPFSIFTNKTLVGTTYEVYSFHPNSPLGDKYMLASAPIHQTISNFKNRKISIFLYLGGAPKNGVIGFALL